MYYLFKYFVYLLNISNSNTDETKFSIISIYTWDQLPNLFLKMFITKFGQMSIFRHLMLNNISSLKSISPAKKIGIAFKNKYCCPLIIWLVHSPWVYQYYPFHQQIPHMTWNHSIKRISTTNQFTISNSVVMETNIIGSMINLLTLILAVH